MKKILALSLSGILAVGLMTGCSQNSETSSEEKEIGVSSEVSETKDTELIFVNYRDIRDLNPHLYAGEMYAQSILYDTLVSITEDGYEGCPGRKLDNQ